MKKVFKVIGYGILLFIVLIGAVVVYVKTALPNVGPPEEIKIEYTAERIERGHYLAWSVCVCMDCHSTRDWSKFSGPIVPGKFGQGGEKFDQSVGLPGAFFSKNITPEGITRYTDGELYRVITTGVTKEGKPLFPIMPYPYYGHLNKEDVYSIISYIRTLDPIKNEVPQGAPDFPVSILINTMPKKADPRPIPDKSDLVAYGSYMITAASCVECHTPFEKGKIVPEFSFSGGREFSFPDGSVVRSANITFDSETGIGNWTADQFVSRFKLFADSGYVAPPASPGEFNTVMPWTMYSHMKEEDLRAMYTYLKSVEPINHKVTKFTSASSKP